MRSGFYGVIITIFTLCAPVLAYDWTTNPGDGTVENPYQISEPEQLVAIGADPNLFGGHFVLTDDIVLPAPQATGPGTFNCPVIGSTDVPFTGTFDGQGHTITGLYLEEYENADFVGLFGVVQSMGDNSGRISNLTLAGPYILTTDSVDNTGALVGHLIAGQISQCAAVKIIQQGMLCGSITDIGDYYHLSTSAEKSTGGLVGLNTQGRLLRCYANIDVQLITPANFRNYTGGLIGKNEGGFIESCYAAAAVGKQGGLPDRGYVGGLIGYDSAGSIMTSYTIPQLAASELPVGVLVGAGSDIDCFLCYADPNGLNDYTVIGVEIKSPEEMKQRETFRGWGDGSWVLDDGKDTPRLAWQNTPGAPIVNAIPAYAGSGTLEAPYQIQDANELNAIGCYRELLNQHYILMNDITFEAPTDGVSNFHSIGARCVPFAGTFDGNNHTIAGLYAENIVYGLFGGVIGTDAGIENLTLQDCYIKSSNDNVGVLAGYVEQAAFRNCTIEASSVSGGDSVGGLVGWMKSGTVERCSVSGSVEGINMVGGLIGRSGPGGAWIDINNGLWNMSVWMGNDPDDAVFISQCQSQTTLLGEEIAGGFLGAHSRGVIDNSVCETIFENEAQIYGGFVGGNFAGPISNCYAVSSRVNPGHYFWSYTGGFVGFEHFDPEYNACYYHIKDQPLYTSAPGTALTEVQMKQRGSFEGWDFAGDSADGDADIWRMCADGIDYPRLNWTFARTGDLTCGDGVDLDDLAAMSRCWLADTTGCDRCDVNGDAWIDLADLAGVSQNWLKTALNLHDDNLYMSVLEVGPNPDPSTVTLTNTGQSATDYRVELPAASDWLSVTPASGTLQSDQSEDLLVAVDVIGSALAPGFYEATYNIVSTNAHNSPLTGRVVLEVVNRYPVLSLDEEYVNFYARETGPNPDPQTVIVENTGNEDAHYTIEYPGGQPAWLDVTPFSATVPQAGQLSLSIAVDVIGSDLPPGEYDQEIHVVCPEDPESPLVIFVHLDMPSLEDYRFLSVNDYWFSFWVGENDPNPYPQEVWLDNYGYQDIDFVVDYPGGKPDWLSLTPDSGTARMMESVPMTLSVDVEGTDLPPGNYEQDIYIYDNPLLLYPTVLTVLLEVVDQYPYLYMMSRYIPWRVAEGGPNPEPRNLWLYNYGDQASHFTIEYPDGQPAWLSVTPASGTVERGDMGDIGVTILTVTPDVVGTGLTAGTYTARFQVVDPESPTSPLEVNVTLEVTN